jgi:hypothetical protein
MSINKKQTAVQILVDSLIKLGYLHSNEFGQSPKVIELINQAKEMFEEQIINAFDDGDYNYHYSRKTGNDFENGEEYFEELYGGNK